MNVDVLRMPGDLQSGGLLGRVVADEPLDVLKVRAIREVEFHRSPM